MFNSGNRRDAATTISTTPTAASHHAPGAMRGGFSVLGADVVVTGNISATADLHIDGRVDGDVACGALVLGPDCIVVGSVAAETARIAGAVQGSVAVRQLQIEGSARIAGDVEYEAITIETGAQVEGHLRHRSPGTLGKVADNVTPITRAVEVEDAQGQMLA